MQGKIIDQQFTMLTSTCLSTQSSPPSSASCRVAVVTPPGRGAVATVLVAGAGSAALVGSLFSAASGIPLPEIPLGKIAFGRWRDNGADGEELVVCRRDATRVEIHCHGGHAAPQQIVTALVARGCAEALWPDIAVDFEPDAIAAEARIALAAVRTERTAAILLDQYRGALRQAIEHVIGSPASRPIAEIASQIAALLQGESLGRHLTMPWRVVVAGRPNVGKSSLINALLGYQRSLVFDQPGTTRDVLTAATVIDGWPIELADTAGLRSSPDPIEAAGVARACENVTAADLVLLVFDASQPWTPDDQSLTDSQPRAIIVLNKCDLLELGEPQPAPGLRISATCGDGLSVLQAAISQSLVPHIPPLGAALPFTSRQTTLLHAALAALRQNDVDAARLALRASARLHF